MPIHQYFTENVSFSKPINLNKLKASIIINLNIRKKLRRIIFFFIFASA